MKQDEVSFSAMDISDQLGITKSRMREIDNSLIKWLNMVEKPIHLRLWNIYNWCFDDKERCYALFMFGVFTDQMNEGRGL
jgi:hypothetical protein